MGAEADAVRAVNGPGHDAKTLLEGGNQLGRRPVVKADGNETTGGFRRCWAEKVTTTNGGDTLSEKIGKTHGTLLYLGDANLGNQAEALGEPGGEAGALGDQGKPRQVTALGLPV